MSTRAGDILLIPKYLPHAVSTPADPGHSVHLAFAIDRDTPPARPPDRGPADTHQEHHLR